MFFAFRGTETEVCRTLTRKWKLGHHQIFCGFATPTVPSRGCSWCASRIFVPGRPPKKRSVHDAPHILKLVRGVENVELKVLGQSLNDIFNVVKYTYSVKNDSFQGFFSDDCHKECLYESLYFFMPFEGRVCIVSLATNRMSLSIEVLFLPRTEAD